MYDLKSIIESNTNDGVIDYEKVMASVDNDYVNPIVAKKTDKEKLYSEAVSTLVKELGIEGETVDDLKLYVKKMGGNTDEIKEANIQLDLKVKELQGLYDKEVEARTNIEKETQLSKQMEAIKGLGVTDPDQVEFLHYKFNKQVTEELPFDQVVTNYAKENKINTDAKFVKDTFGLGGEGGIDISEAYKKLRK